MSPLTQFPRADLAPLRHQQVRALLVREAAGASSRRRAAARRAAPVVAALTVVGVAAGGALAGSPLADRLGDVLAAAAGQDAADDLVCGGLRRPGPDDDPSAVRYLPAGLSPTSVTHGLTAMCVGHRDPEGLTVDDPWDTTPMWSLARLDTRGQVGAVLTVWRSLSPGVSADMADGRTTRTAFVNGDHFVNGGQGTAVDPPYAKVTVRGRPGTLVRPSTGFVSDPVITWTEPDGQRWSVTADGLDAADLLAFADALDIDDDTARPGWTPAVPSTVSTLQEALGAPQKDSAPARPYWLRLDVPAAGVHAPPATVTAIDVPRLLATFTHPEAGRVTFEADASRGPWQAEIRAGDRIRPLAGGVLAAERADEQGPGRYVLWSLPSGAPAELSGSSGGDAVLALAASVEPVAAGDPRLAGPVVEQPGVRPDGTTP